MEVAPLLRGTVIDPYVSELQAAVDVRLAQIHGDVEDWQAALNQLPDITVDGVCLNADAVGTSGSLSSEQSAQLRSAMIALHPWRKGPFDLNGLFIDSEWQSNLKWNRLSEFITPLTDRLVLDIGCGNGYYLWRMLGQGARLALGIDPTRRFLYQFAALQRYLGQHNATGILPIGIEDLPDTLTGFDTVFSMGILYHRKNHCEHLQQLQRLLRPGGEVVLETLVLDQSDGAVLVPNDRYAQMRNVWAIPSVPVLERWMIESGFKNVRTVDVSGTTTKEQRATNWMTFQSLSDFLDPSDPRMTIEGYPAPVRAIVLANTPVGCG